MTAQLTTELLKLNGDKALALSVLRDGRSAEWLSKSQRGRLRNLGLITVTGAVLTLTELGRVVIDALSAHVLITHSTPLGRGTLRGAGMMYGVKARCSCGGWNWKTNESGVEAKRAAVRNHVQHMLDCHS